VCAPVGLAVVNVLSLAPEGDRRAPLSTVFCQTEVHSHFRLPSDSLHPKQAVRAPVGSAVVKTLSCGWAPEEENRRAALPLEYFKVRDHT